MTDIYDDAKTVATAPHDLLKIIILERRKFFIDAMERYNKNKFGSRNSAPDLARMRAEMGSLFFELQAALKRDLGDKKLSEYKGHGVDEDDKAMSVYVWLKQHVEGKSAKNMTAAYYFLNEWLDDKKFIRIDTKRQYDSTRAENENRMKSL